MADSSRVSLAYLKEVTWGTTPASAGKEFRFVSESLKPIPTFVTSNEIRSDRQITDHVRTAMAGGGAVQIEASCGAFDDMLEGAQQSTWGTTVSFTGADISFSSVDNSINSSSTTFTGRGILVGQWLYTSGAVASANNGWKRVVSVAANKIVVSHATLTTAAASPTITVKGTGLQNGTTATSFSLEKSFNDVSGGAFEPYKGQRIGQWGLSWSAGEILTGNFNFTGIGPTALATSSQFTGSVTAASTNAVLNATDNVAFYEGGTLTTASSVALTKFDFTYDNKAAGRPAIGSLAPIGVRTGTIEVTGTLEAYFESITLYNKYLANTATSLAMVLSDTVAGAGLVLDFHSVEFTDGEVLTPGKDVDIMAKLTWAAKRDTTVGKTLSITRMS